MTWFSYIFPQTILRTSSKYNSHIRINEERGKLKLLVNGSRESGEYIEKLWKEAFAAFGFGGLGSGLKLHQGLTPSILVLGVAVGTVIHLARRMYPKAAITGVDIDKVMLDIGRTYFGLGEAKGLTLIHQDAKQYVQKAVVQKKQYDLIIVDLFLGREIPGFVESQSFLRQLHRLLKKDGRVIINFLRELEYESVSDKLMERLKKTFRVVQDFGLYHNRFFWAR